MQGPGKKTAWRPWAIFPDSLLLHLPTYLPANQNAAFAAAFEHVTAGRQSSHWSQPSAMGDAAGRPKYVYGVPPKPSAWPPVADGQEFVVSCPDIGLSAVMKVSAGRIECWWRRF